MHIPPSNFTAAAIAILACLTATACSRRSPVDTGRAVHSRELMGTLVTITSEGSAFSRDKGVEMAFAVMTTEEARLSRYQPASDASRISAGAGRSPVPVSTTTLNVLRLSAEVSRLSGGAFDVTIGPLVLLWKDGAKFGRIPDSSAVERAQRKVDWTAVKLDGKNRTVTLPEGMAVDLGGLAKGYIVDRAVEALKTAGIDAGIVEAGGDLSAFGRPLGRDGWRVGVQDPRNPSLAKPVAVLSIRDKAIATSGHYRRFSKIEGRRFSHIIDPRTGRPVENELLSITLIAPTCALADGLATAVGVLGEKKGLALVDALSGVDCLLIKDDGDGGLRFVLSRGMNRYAKFP
jgi:thiamine biosynthesis lipoprotein